MKNPITLLLQYIKQRSVVKKRAATRKRNAAIKKAAGDKNEVLKD